jgi:hypothetical protein
MRCHGRNVSGDVFHDKVERVGETGKLRCIRKRKGHHRKKANCLGLRQKEEHAVHTVGHVRRRYVAAG